MNPEIFNKIFYEVKPVQNKEELMWLINRVESIKPKTILEIGTEYGGTFKFWENILKSSLNPESLLIGIDLNNNIRWNTKESIINIEFIKGDSTDQKTYIQLTNILRQTNNLNQGIDFLFIDGGHDYNTVSSDYNIYKNFIKHPSIIGFHDINDGNGVSQFWSSLPEPTKKESFTSKENGIGIGLIYL